MKLRCVQNSIRLRLKKSDLQKLKEQTIIKETVSFGKATIFTYSIKIKRNVDKVFASYNEKGIEIAVPVKIAMNWINSNDVGIEINNQFDNGDTLHILIEKDFPCVDRVEEDKSDTFFELAAKKSDLC